jgi:radical SAM-linked protein
MARPVPGGPPPAPIVQRLTIRYAKRGRMRFASHRDVARAIERGVRKAGVPVAYSAGFSPHPRISYAGGAPTGSASEAEYLELALTRRCGPADVGRLLHAALPDGIDVIEVVEADGKSAGVQLEASEWEVIWPGAEPAAAARAVGAFLAAPNVEVERLTSKGIRRFDAREAVLRLSVTPGRSGEPDPAAPAAGCAILRMIVRHMSPAVRPDDVMTALSQFSASAPASPPVVTRLWQGPLSELPPPALGGRPPGEAATAEAATAETASGRADTIIEPERRRPVQQGPGQHGPEPRPEQDGPGGTTDKAVCLEAESAGAAPAGQARANEQLPRGARGQLADQRAREPYGRDCPDARDRATEPTVRSS